MGEVEKNEDENKSKWKMLRLVSIDGESSVLSLWSEQSWHCQPLFWDKIKCSLIEHDSLHFMK